MGGSQTGVAAQRRGCGPSSGQGGSSGENVVRWTSGGGNKLGAGRGGRQVQRLWRKMVRVEQEGLQLRKTPFQSSGDSC